MIGQLPDTTHHGYAFEIWNSTFGLRHFATPRYEMGVFKTGVFKTGVFITGIIKTGFAENLGLSTYVYLTTYDGTNIPIHMNFEKSWYQI